jgi:hypothetical protein
MISKSEFHRLAETHEQLCVSIYLPVESIGEEMGKQQGPKRLKATLPRLRSGLKEHNIKNAELDQYMDPIEDLMEREESWKNLEGCMAIFLNKQGMEHYTLPVEMELMTYISDHFYLLPIIPLFNDDKENQLLKKFRKKRLRIARTFRSLSTGHNVSADPNEIVAAAIDGKVRILFIERSKDLYGLYDSVNRSLIVDKENRANQDSLYNMAAVQTWSKGGEVYLADKNEMPLKGSSINALFK